MWLTREVHYPTNLLLAADRFADGGEFCLIDGIAEGQSTTLPTHSMICREPLAVFELRRNEQPRLRFGRSITRTGSHGWQFFADISRSLPRMPKAPLARAPGWVGYFGYEMNALLERLPAPREPLVDIPIAHIGLFDTVIVLEHPRRRAFALSAPGLAESLNVPRSSALEHECERWNAAVRAADRLQSASKTDTDSLHSMKVEVPVSQLEYERLVTRVLNYIAAGDIYQANISHPIVLRGVSNPLALAQRVRASNPAAFSAYLRWGPHTVISASPEKFLSLNDGVVTTRPIKGTARRSHDEFLDSLARQALIDSVKERAELAMIVDLHRNDIGRVCEPGSVLVESARELEVHPQVFHTVAEIRGRLGAGRDAIDLLRACFPPGSVTGVPKIRAMEIIHECESIARGAYCGSICAMGLDGSLAANVAIRTLQISETTGVMHVGGGVVAESEPAAEYDETLAKAQTFLVALSPDGALVNPPLSPLHYD